MIIIMDNYDSFTYNLYQYVGTLNSDIEVYRNDKITVDEIREKKPERIILSPGPKYPEDAGICIELVKRLGSEIPILGVCLGHQSIGRAFGGNIVRSKIPMHGKPDEIEIDAGSKLFSGLDKKITVGRYHSLIIEKESLPECLKITGMSKDGSIMAVEHKEYPVYGIQFHPESYLIKDGMKIIENFLKIS